MEYLLLIAALGAFFIIVFIREAYLAGKRERQFRASLYENYGKSPQKEYPLERYVRMDSFFRRHMREGQIDDITWNDLNLDEIFKRMNDTFSASGEEYLYYTLRNTAKTQEELAHLEEAVTWFMEYPDERVKVQLLMRRLGHTGRYSLYDYLDNLDYLGERSNKKHILCDLLFLPLIALAPFKLSFSLLGIAVLMVHNIMTYFKEKGEIDPYLVSFDYVLRLIDVCKELGRIEIPPCAGEWEKMRAHREQLKGVQQGSYLVLSGGRSAGTGNPLDMLMDYIRMAFHVDLIQFNKMLSRLRLHMADVDGLIETVGYVETAIAIGSFRKSLENGYCIPEFTEEGGLSLKEAYHPLLNNPVKNSIDADRGVLITGSNASGKSTFLKMAAINVILAQTIHTCTAEYYRAPVYTIYSSMALRDDIQSGESYYIVEIKALKRILDAAKEGSGRVLCFVDEVLRGTNTVERIAASTQILKSLTGSNIMCFAATHDIELTNLLAEEYDNYHFEEEVKDGDVKFPYILMKGKAATRNAIRLLSIMGYDGQIIERATRQAEQFVETGKWFRS